MTTYYAAIDSGSITGAVYGVGESPAAATTQAREGGADGELRIVECSDQAAAWVEEMGGAPSRELLVGPEGVIRRGESKGEDVIAIAAAHLAGIEGGLAGAVADLRAGKGERDACGLGDSWQLPEGVSVDEVEAEVIRHARAAAEVADLVTAVEAAIGTWDTANWTHALTIDGSQHVDEHGEPVYCEGGNEACETCRAAQESAEEADELAEEAVTELHAGALAGAADLLEQAAAQEREYGDAPTWGPLAKRARALAGKD